MSDVVSTSKPVTQIARYLWRHRAAHTVVILAILGAVAASVAARYSMKFLVDTMTADHSHMAGVWQAVAIFTACVGADNVLWRVAGWAGAGAFPAIGAELRLDLFRHLLGQSSRYFNERFSGALAGRVTTAATGLFTLENLFTWNVLPAAAATLGSVIGLGTVSWEIAAALAAAAVVVGVGIAFAALRAGPLNHLFAERAAAAGARRRDRGASPRARLYRASSPCPCHGGLGDKRRGACLERRALGGRHDHGGRRRGVRLLRAGVIAVVARFGGGAGRHPTPLEPRLRGGGDAHRAARYARPRGLHAVPLPGRHDRARQRLLRPRPQPHHARERQPARPGRAEPGCRRPVRRRQEHALGPAAAALPGESGPHPHRRSGHCIAAAGEPAPRHRRGAAGHLAVPSLRPREHPLWAPRRD